MAEQIDPEMLEIYRKEAEAALVSIKNALKKVKKNPADQKEIFNLYRAVHTLKSSSFQMGFYSVGYLANLMNTMLQEIKIRKIILGRDKIAFLDDFSGTLEKAVAYVLKKKEIKFDAKLFDRVSEIMEVSEKERIKNAELEMQKQVGKVEDDELFALYIKTSEELIEKIEPCLNNLKKKYSEKAINEIIVNSHTLEGNSLQMNYPIMGYFASKIKSYSREILAKKSLNKEQIAYLLDLFGTINTYFNSIKNGKEMLSKELSEKLSALIKEDYAEIEKKLKQVIGNK